MKNISWEANGTNVATFTYQYQTNSDRISRLTLSDSSYWSYSYDPKGQLVSGKRCLPAGAGLPVGTPYPGFQFGYEYDEIGNVVKAGPLAENGRPRWSFTADEFNRHTSRSWGSLWDILGSAATNAFVTVNGIPAYRAGEPFQAVVPVSNQVQAVETNIKAIAIGPSGTQELQAAVSGRLYLPKAVETVTYRPTGTIEEDSRFTYAWDGYGRLTNVVSTHAATNFMLEFTYYPDGQRATKVVSNWNGSACSPIRTNSYVYDGWNLISERITESTNAPITKTYSWGLDLAGRKTGKLGQEAGGIGGLLAITVVQGSSTNVYLPVSDHNGNITALLDAESGLVVAQYWYSPFGVLIGELGSAKDICPFRFQSKYYDEETGLYYFGHRYYDPASCKWLSPDPLGESAGPNGSSFCRNEPVGRGDPLGLIIYVLLPSEQESLDATERNLRIAWKQFESSQNRERFLLKKRIMQTEGSIAQRGGSLAGPSKKIFVSKSTVGPSLEEMKKLLSEKPPIECMDVATRQDIDSAIAKMVEVQALVLVGHGDKPGTQEIGRDNYDLNQLRLIVGPLQGRTTYPSVLLLQGCKAANTTDAMQGSEFLRSVAAAGGFSFAYGLGENTTRTAEPSVVEWRKAWGQLAAGMGFAGPPGQYWYYDPRLTRAVFVGMHAGEESLVSIPEFIKPFLAQPVMDNAWELRYKANLSNTSP